MNERPRRVLSALLLSLCACPSKGPVDADGDGIAATEDCDDTDPSVYPGADERPYDGIDNDCDAATPDDDLDADGRLLVDDCDDLDANIGGDEVIYDGIDNDCDAATPDDDLDADGWPLADDCDDADPQRNPSIAEIPRDGIDNDCDALVDCDDPDLPTETWEGNVDATDVSGLCDGYCARPIDGSLTIASSTLGNLDGLECVTSVSDYVVINGNFALTSLRGLDHLASIGTDLYIIGNPLLSDVSALHGLASVGGDLAITGNPSLPAASVQDLLDAIGTIGGTIDVDGI